MPGPPSMSLGWPCCPAMLPQAPYTAPLGPTAVKVRTLWNEQKNCQYTKPSPPGANRDTSFRKRAPRLSLSLSPVITCSSAVHQRRSSHAACRSAHLSERSREDWPPQGPLATCVGFVAFGSPRWALVFAVVSSFSVSPRSALGFAVVSLFSVFPRAALVFAAVSLFSAFRVRRWLSRWFRYFPFSAFGVGFRVGFVLPAFGVLSVVSLSYCAFRVDFGVGQRGRKK